MGSDWSAPQPQGSESYRVLQYARKQLSEIERYSLRKREITELSLADQLGTQAYGPGTAVLLRSGRFFAGYPAGPAPDIVPNIEKVVTFFNGRLRTALALDDAEWLRMLFLSIAATTDDVSASSDVEHFYIAYDDLLALWTLLIAAYDSNSREGVVVKDDDPINHTVAQRLLESVKAPIVGFAAFKQLLEVYPGITSALHTIWDQLLYETSTTYRKPEQHSRELQGLPRDICAELHVVLGPKFDHALRLYNGTRNGFSMRAFEKATTKWRSPSVLVVQGRPISRNKAGSEIDTYMPPIYDAPARRDTRRVAFAIYVESSWKMSAKACFSEPQNTRIISLAPEFQVFVPNDAQHTVFFSPQVGIGAGMPPPQQKQTPRHTHSIVLMLDTALEHGVFRHLGTSGKHLKSQLKTNTLSPMYEYRFLIDHVDVYGLGTAADLENARKAWEWEDREASRRQGVNVGISEDRAILELAGLVGQYHQRRSD